MSHQPLCSPEVYVALVATIIVVLTLAGYLAGMLDDRFQRRRAEKQLDRGAEYDNALARKEDQ